MNSETAALAELYKSAWDAMSVFAEQSHSKPSLPVVSTMTIGCRAISGPLPIDLDAVAGTRHAAPYTNVKKGRNSFRNCILLSVPKIDICVQGSPKFGVKIFANGAIHLTGLKTFEQLDGLAKKVEACLNDSGQKYELHGFALQLLNSYFKIGRRLKLARANAILSPDASFFSRGISAHYPALVVKMPLEDHCTVSLHLFSTGTVLISGIKNPPQVAEAFCRIVRVLQTHADEVMF